MIPGLTSQGTTISSFDKSGMTTNKLMVKKIDIPSVVHKIWFLGEGQVSA